METAVRFVPDKDPDPLMHKHGYLGKPISRVDGPAKVKGEARFTAEHVVENVAYAAVVCSTIATGRITRIETEAAEREPGVLAFITHVNAPRMKHPTLLNVMNIGKGVGGSELPLLQEDLVHYDGEPIAVVVAETLEEAEHAALMVWVEYDVESPSVSFDALKPEAVVPKDVLGEDPEFRKGDAEAALAAAAFKTDYLYRTPRHNHNAIEPHATIAFWGEGGHLTVFDSTQYVNGFKHQRAEVFSLKPDDIRVISPFVGGAFGGKWAMWPNTVLCAAAAKVAGRPVKLVLSREDVFRMVGGRTLAEQRVGLGANRDGKLVSLIHTGTTATTTHAKYPEQFSLTPRHLYAAENLFVGQKIVNLDTVANTWMRAPGEAIATFALESAIDELAYAMAVDPIELRRINEPTKDPTKNTEFSMRNLVEAYQRGSDRFGWSQRNPEPRSQRDGAWLVGQGVATAYYPFFRWPATVRVRVSSDGSADILAAAHEMGMGTATVQIQHAAERLALPIEKVSFYYGDTAFPDSPITAGGSSQTVTIAAAVQEAIEKAHRQLHTLAAKSAGSPLAGTKYAEVEARDGGLYQAQEGKGETYASILQRASQDYVEVEASTGMATELMKYSMASYGAQFCEVRVNEITGEVRVSRWVGSFDCGRIVSPKTATSQFRGGIVMGIGMALMEETFFDERRGRIMNRSLAEYHVPVHLDVPHIDRHHLQRHPGRARSAGCTWRRRNWHHRRSRSSCKCGVSRHGKAGSRVAYYAGQTSLA
ncbi:xanthine dehydrogenase family protein molybdopterin-binding subunit [Cupriavidus pinatubonensis]|nr:xanthine dehydrogenase family protein molybdopterin-binding subunit [Cupriavidus pinatubonensis]